VPFVKCSNCNTLLKWRSKDGTSSLSGHQEHCSSKGSSQTRKITDIPGYKNASTAAVPSTVKSQMANDLVHMCATDIRLFSIVDGGRFKKVAQKLISVGAQYGNVSAGREFQSTDTRRFSFAIVCTSCGQMHASLQETRAHLKNCPQGLAVDVLCGHCKLRTSSWPTMCAHLNATGTQKEVACKPEYRLSHPPRPEFRRASLSLQPSALPMTTVATGQASDRRKLQTRRSPPQLTLSPTREEARERRQVELRSALVDWNRKHPRRVGIRGPGQRLPDIPLEPVSTSGYRLPSAAL